MRGTEAIDIFIESDPNSDGDEGPSFISIRVPYEREFAQQVRELGAKWDDRSKEWRLYGSEEVVKQVASLCKTIFPRLPRRRNRLVAAEVSTHEGKTWLNEGNASTKQLELIVRVQFVVNRTVKNYRVGQNLKWVKDFKQVIEVPADHEADSSAEEQSQFAVQMRGELAELERVAAAAFEALLIGRKEAVKAILSEAEIEQA